MTLEDDMLTLRTEPRRLLPTVGHSRGTGFAGHELFEASSIRKIRGKYYLVYSSIACHELCYAVSDRPDRGFRYGGVVVSNCDLFPGEKPRYAFGNNHGGLECINGAVLHLLSPPHQPQHVFPAGLRRAGGDPAGRQHSPGVRDKLRAQRRTAGS